MSTSVVPIVPIASTGNAALGTNGSAVSQTVIRPPSPIIVSTPQLTTSMTVRPSSPTVVSLTTQRVPMTANVASLEQAIASARSTRTADIPVISRTRTIPAVSAVSVVPTGVALPSVSAANAMRSSTNPVVLTPGPLVAVLPTTVRPPSPTISVVRTRPPSPVVPITNSTVRPPSPIITTMTIRPPSPGVTMMTVTRPPSPVVTVSPITTPVLRTVTRPPSPIATVAPITTPVLMTATAPTIITAIAPLPSAALLNTPVSSSRTVHSVNTSSMTAQIFSGLGSFPLLPLSPIKTPIVVVTCNSSLSEATVAPQIQVVTSTYQSLITTVGLEAELLSARYWIEGTITLTNEQNERRIQYIKAINAKGQRVYIIVDVNGFLSNQRNLSMIRLNNPARVHHSTKLDGYDCVKNYVDGVVFEIGADGLSTIIRDSQSLQPVEINYTLIGQQLDNDIDNNGTVMTYPIIRMSQIRADPDQILENTSQAFNCLRFTTIGRHTDAIEELNSSFSDLSNAWTSFKDVRSQITLALAGEISQLIDWNKAFDERVITTDNDRDKVNSIQRNLAIRQERLEDILRLTRKVVNRMSQIDAITAEINAVTSVIDNNNGDLGTIL